MQEITSVKLYRWHVTEDTGSAWCYLPYMVFNTHPIAEDKFYKGTDDGGQDYSLLEEHSFYQASNGEIYFQDGRLCKFLMGPWGLPMLVVGDAYMGQIEGADPRLKYNE